MLPVTVIISTLAVVIALIVGLLIWRRQRIGQLLKDGVNINGVVVNQWWRNPRGPATRRYYVRYRYQDGGGNEYTSRRCRVAYDYWTEHPPGSAIAVTYSASRPHISALRHIVDVARVAKQRQG